MKTSFKVILGLLILIAAGAVTALFMMSHSIPVLEPKGLIGDKQRDLIFKSVYLMLIVVVPVFILTIVIALKYRESNKDEKYEPEWDHSVLAETLWWGIPFVIIIFLGILTWTSSHELNPFRPIVNGKKPVTIQAVALQWKWLFIYPEQGIATVSYVQIPEKTPINFEITADAPMNSFWIPQLGGQIYAMPAMRSKLHLLANETGTYRGTSANLSGSGFAGMSFEVKSTSDSEFNEWAENVRTSSKGLDFQEYNQLAKPSSYVDPEFYSLEQDNLFELIIKKYSPR